MFGKELTLWGKEKRVNINIFSFFHNALCPMKDKPSQFEQESF